MDTNPVNPITDNPDFRNVAKLRDIIKEALNNSWNVQYDLRDEVLEEVKKPLRDALDFIHMNFYKLEPIPDYGDHMTVEEWKEAVAMGAFIDYDGHGKLATENSMSNITIVPSDLFYQKTEIPLWWTHVVWFNR